MVKPKGGIFENNAPVGSAGQPTGKNDAKMNAIQRRLNKKKDKDTGKNGRT